MRYLLLINSRKNTIDICVEYIYLNTSRNRTHTKQTKLLRKFDLSQNNLVLAELFPSYHDVI